MIATILSLFLWVLISCVPNGDEHWEFTETIPLEEVGIIGLEYDPERDLFWVSDGDNNRLIKVDNEGKTVEDIHQFSRPMHLSYREGILYLAEYGADRIILIDGEELVSIPLPRAPDAPSSIDVDGDRIAVADFYNHRIIFWDEEGDYSFGVEGSEAGQFHYPTQVRFFDGKLFVADAYNHRIQVFDSKDRSHLQTLGSDDGMNATTGLYVDEDGIYATDFENSRVLIYNHDGKLVQILEENIDKPTAVIKHKSTLFIANYGDQSISRFQLK